MPRAIWSGSISFGLVNIPVQLFSAIKHREVQFHEVHDKDAKRLREKRVCSADGKEVTYDHVAKAYELSPRRMVVVTQQELEAVDPKTSRTIDIEDFVELGDIDPIFYLHTYYIVPEPQARKAYALLLRAMRKSKRVGIARLVMRQRQYLAALRPVSTAIVLSTMLYADEIVPERRLPGLSLKSVSVSPKETKLAEQVIGSLSTRFNAAKYHDEYRARVLALISKKARGQKIKLVKTSKPSPTRVADLIKQLEDSISRR